MTTVLKRCWHRHLGVAAHEGHGVEMALHDLAEIDEGEPALVVDHRVERQGPAQHADDGQLLLVQRVAVEDAVGGARVGHEGGSCGRW